MMGVHKFRANILNTCKGHHNPTLWCNYFFQNSLPVISYRLFNVFSKIFFLLQTFKFLIILNEILSEAKFQDSL